MNDVHAKAKKGIKTLMGRQVIMQILTFSSGIILARILGPAQFGLFAIAGFLVSTFAVFGDFGLAPSLIQRKEELDERDLQVSFTLQQVFTTVIVIALFVAAPWLAHLYPKAPPATVWLVRALALNLYFNSWRTMSALQLERHLQYNKLARVDVIGAIIYQGVVLLLAVLGYGVWSFTWATLLSALVSAVLMYAAAPWPVRFAYDWESAQDILRYGIPFQLQSIIGSIGGWVTPVFVGHWIGPQGVGFLTWAGSNGRKPIQYLDSVRRVAFPHFARIQHDGEEVCRTIERYLSVAIPLTGLWFCLMFVVAPMVVQPIYTLKWVPAVPALILYAVMLNFEVVSGLIGTTLMSLGRVQIELRVMMISTVIGLVTGYILVRLIGFVGVPISYIICCTVTMPFTMYNVDKGLPIRVYRIYLRAVPALVVSCAVGKALQAIPGVPRVSLWVGLVLALAVSAAYTGVTWLFSPVWLKQKVLGSRYLGGLRRITPVRKAA